MSKGEARKSSAEEFCSMNKVLDKIRLEINSLKCGFNNRNELNNTTKYHTGF